MMIIKIKSHKNDDKKDDDHKKDDRGDDDRKHKDKEEDDDDDFEYQRVSSAVVLLNGEMLLAPNELNRHVKYIEKTVTLQRLNELSVKVRGKRGGALIIYIISQNTHSPDTLGPTITTTLTPPANSAGWSNADTTISFTCQDNESGMAFCPAPIISNEGEGLVVTGEARDNAGNIATTRVLLNIDKTLPTINATATPSANASGWLKNKVTVSFDCQDIGAGVASCSEPVTMTTEAANQLIIGTVTDRAGNTTTTTISISLDKTAPSINVSTSSVANTDFSGTPILNITMSRILLTN